MVRSGFLGPATAAGVVSAICFVFAVALVALAIRLRDASVSGGVFLYAEDWACTDNKTKMSVPVTNSATGRSEMVPVEVEMCSRWERLPSPR